MEPKDITVEILKDIRAEVRATREELSQRIDETRRELSQTREELSQRIDLLAQGQVQLATEVVGVGAAVREVSDLMREDRGLRARVDEHDRRIEAIEGRLG